MSRTVALQKRGLDSNNKFFDVVCSSCTNKVTHQILEAIDTVWVEDDSSGWESYQIIQCQACQTLSFCKESQLSDCIGIKPDTDKTVFLRFLDFYPERGDIQSSLSLPHNLPVIIEKIYCEIIHAFNTKLLVVAGLGVRAMIEGVCRDKKILKGAPLALKIEGLADTGHITADGAKILHSLSAMRGTPMHEAMDVDVKKLRAAIEVIDHLIKGAYVLPELAKNVNTAA